MFYILILPAVFIFILIGASVLADKMLDEK